MTVCLPHNTILQGHVLDKLAELPNNCVDVVVTSTPYLGLRDYGPECISVWDGKCGVWKGQLGLEPHPQMFIDHLVRVFNEVKRVLKPTGSLWLNLGDTYFGGNGQCCRPKDWGDLEVSKIEAHAPADFIRARNKLRSNWLQPKQKMLIPARVAIALQEQGWILRNEVIWHKVNHMPESVTDRLTRSYESVYFFVKSSRYHFDLDAVRKPHKDIDNGKRINLANKWKSLPVNSPLLQHQGINLHPLGANPGDVWSLTQEGLKEQHFAAFPQKLVKRILSCACPKNGLVLDPFAGAGTSLLVAHKMGFDWLGIELVSKYCEIAEKRILAHGKIRLDKFIVDVSRQEVNQPLIGVNQQEAMS